MISDWRGLVRAARRGRYLHSWVEWRLIRWPVTLHCARRELQPDGTGCPNDKGADSIVRNPRLRAPHYK